MRGLVPAGSTQRSRVRIVEVRVQRVPRVPRVQGRALLFDLSLLLLLLLLLLLFLFVSFSSYPCLSVHFLWSSQLFVYAVFDFIILFFIFLLFLSFFCLVSIDFHIIL